MRIWSKEGLEEEDLRQCFERLKSNGGTNNKKNRAYGRKGLAVDPVQQYHRTAFGAGLENGRSKDKEDIAILWREKM